MKDRRMKERAHPELYYCEKCKEITDHWGKSKSSVKCLTCGARSNPMARTREINKIMENGTDRIPKTVRRQHGL